MISTHQNISMFSFNSNSKWRREFVWRANQSNKISFFRQHLNSFVVIISNNEVSFFINSNSTWIIELSWFQEIQKNSQFEEVQLPFKIKLKLNKNKNKIK